MRLEGDGYAAAEINYQTSNTTVVTRCNRYASRKVTGKVVIRH
jgi:hypothetical protein